MQAAALSLLFLPLISFMLLLVWLPKNRSLGPWVASTLMGFCLIPSFYLFLQVWGQDPFRLQVTWFQINPDTTINLGLLLNNQTVFMGLVVALVALLVHIFSIEYMKQDPDKQRYFAYLGLFTFSMLGIVLADNLLQIYFFWELVGLSSYLLIGFWYKKASAVKASRKAFLVNRIGDAGFLVGIIWIYMIFGSFNLELIQAELLNLDMQQPLRHIPFTLIGFCLFCGVMGKSAQFPLHIWLPDAMEGPTPVSALIHAATMVAAGVFLLGRIFFLLDVNVLVIITFIGTITAFVGAFSALMQKDIKKVLAYSTISQLGYMIIGMGVGAYEAGLFHLLSHAFFKAGLFLGAGVIIHQMHTLAHDLDFHFDAQNMYLMGGLREKMPITFLTFAICGAALVGLPFTSGFLSKDAILSASLAWAAMMGEEGSYFFYVVPGIAFLSVLLTALYVGRLFYLVFLGKFRLVKLYSKARHSSFELKEGNWLLTIPLLLLSFLSLWFVFSWNPFSAEASWFMQSLETPLNIFLGESRQSHLLEVQHHYHFFTLISSITLSLSGLLIITWLFRGRRFKAKSMTFRSKQAYALSENSFYLDRFYEDYLIRSFLSLSSVLAWFDQKVIDALVNFLGVFKIVLAHIIAWIDRDFVDGFVSLIVWLTGSLGKLSRSLQSGKIQSYFVIATLGLVLILVFFVW